MNEQQTKDFLKSMGLSDLDIEKVNSLFVDAKFTGEQIALITAIAIGSTKAICDQKVAELELQLRNNLPR